MAFNGSFSVAITSSPGTFILTDISTGSDTNLTGRTVSLYKQDGTLLVAAIPWIIANSTITIAALTKDYSLRISVAWASSAPIAPPSSYVYSVLYTFTGYLKYFWYQQIQRVTANPVLATQRLFKQSLCFLDMYIDCANLATTQNDQTNAQLMLNSAYYLQQNQTSFF